MKHTVSIESQETFALVKSIELLSPLCWDQQWRVLNYLLIRLLGRSWSLNKPATDNQ